jgi:hypothetical protein
MKFVNTVANKSASELEVSKKAKLRTFSGEDKAERPAMNPPPHKPDPFAPKIKEHRDPTIIKAPVASSVRGQQKEATPITNADIMAFLLKNLGK